MTKMTKSMTAALQLLADGNVQFVGQDERISRYTAKRLEDAGLVVWVRGRTWDVGASRVFLSDAGRQALQTPTQNQ